MELKVEIPAAPPHRAERNRHGWPGSEACPTWAASTGRRNMRNADTIGTMGALAADMAGMRLRYRDSIA